LEQIEAEELSPAGNFELPTLKVCFISSMLFKWLINISSSFFSQTDTARATSLSENNKNVVLLPEV